MAIADLQSVMEAAGINAREIPEVKYLCVGKVPIHRTIVAFVYDRDETSESGWVWPAEVAEYVRRVRGEPSYTDETCRRDLQALETWNVVLSEADLDEANTVAEFYDREKRFQISERGRQIEKMVRELESDAGVRGSLDPTRIERLWRALLEMHARLERAAGGAADTMLAEVEGDWNLIEDTRAQIEEQTRRYLNELSKNSSATASDGDVFVVYKRLVRQYIDEFLIHLQSFNRKCSELFETWRHEEYDERLVSLMVANEMRRKGDRRSEAELTRIYEGAVRRLLGLGGRDGTARILEQKTMARLMSLLGQIERIVLDRGSTVDRKKDLERLALAFRKAPSDLAAAEIAAEVFDWGTPEHMYAFTGTSDEVNDEESVWVQEPWALPLKPNTRGNPQFGRITPVKDRRLERALLRKKRAEERQEIMNFWEGLFAEGAVSLDDLEVPDNQSLNRVTRLVRDCIRSPDRYAHLEDGTVVRLSLPTDLSRLGEVRCPQGVYYTRAYVLTRERRA